MSQEGGLVYGSSVPSSLGLDVTFDSYQYDSGNGPADGIAFFLAASDPTNASASPITLGPSVATSGTRPTRSTARGLTHGYLGFGLDVFGNYSNKELDPACNETPCVRAGVGRRARSG